MTTDPRALAARHVQEHDVPGWVLLGLTGPTLDAHRTRRINQITADPTRVERLHARYGPTLACTCDRCGNACVEELSWPGGGGVAWCRDTAGCQTRTGGTR